MIFVNQHQERQPLSVKVLSELHDFGSTVIRATRPEVLRILSSGDLGTETKSDGSPVTRADKAAEQILREMVADRYPHHGVIGEEFGVTNPRAEFQWTMDGIDGTINAVHGVPTFGTLLGLRYGGEAVLGWIDHPALDRLTHGGPGVGVYAHGIISGMPQNELSPLIDLPHDDACRAAIVAASRYEAFQRSGEGAVLSRLQEQHSNVYIYNDCFAHSLVVSGVLAASVEFNLRIWDLTPAEALVRGVGGEFRYLPRAGERAAIEPRHAVDHCEMQYHAILGKPRMVGYLSSLIHAAA